MTEGARFTVEPKPANCHDSGAVADFTEGQLIALRRDKLGWTQEDLANAIGVSQSTILRVEKGTNQQRPNYLAALAVIEKEEARRGSSGPNLSIVAGSIEPSKEKADALKKIEDAKMGLVRLHVFLSTSVDEIEQAVADLDALAAVHNKHA